jgi:hypothetical protein
VPGINNKPDLRAIGDEPHRVIGVLEGARPLSWSSDVPERFTVDVEADGAGWVVISQLDDPEWHGRWSGPEGEKAAEIVRVLGNRVAGWQGIPVPGKGRWTLNLTYQGRAARIGLAVSLASWCVWLAAYAILKRRESQRGERV